MFYYNMDKPQLYELIEETNSIKKMFHQIEDKNGIKKDIINDVQEYKEWRQKIIFELQGIYDSTHDQYILEALNYCKFGMDSKDEKEDFSELTAKLNVIYENLEKYYPKSNNNIQPHKESKVQQKMNKKSPKIFISHSSKDIEYVKILVNLLDGMGLDQTQVFCSSLPGYGIPIDEDIFDYLRKQFFENNLHVIFIHSENYYRSPISLNEMGAAWALKTEATSILLPNFEFDQMKGVVDAHTISIKLDINKMELQDKLNQLYDKIVAEFKIQKKAPIIWEQKRDSFIREITQLLNHE